MTHDDQTPPTRVATMPHRHHVKPNQPIWIQPKPLGIQNPTNWNPKSNHPNPKKQKSMAKNQNPNPIRIGIHTKPHRNPSKIKTQLPLPRPTRSRHAMSPWPHLSPPLHTSPQSTSARTTHLATTFNSKPLTPTHRQSFGYKSQSSASGKAWAQIQVINKLSSPSSKMRRLRRQTHDPVHAAIPTPENSHHHELKRDVRERSLDCSRERERRRHEERERADRFFGIKNNIWDLGLCYSTIIYLRWYYSTIVNFFGFTSPSNGGFLGLWC